MICHVFYQATIYFKLQQNWGIPYLLQHHYIFQVSVPVLSHHNFFPRSSALLFSKYLQ